MRHQALAVLLALAASACTGGGTTTTTSAPTTTTVATTTTTVATTTSTTAAAAVVPDPGALRVVLVWRYPAAPSPAGGIDPAVRTAAARDVPDLAAVAAAVPGLRVVVAPDPAFLGDLEALAGGAEDELFRLATMPVGALDAGDRAAIRDRFFDVPAGSFDRWPRLGELRDRVDAGTDLDDRHLRDLQVLHLLAWLDLDHVGDERLRDIARRGRDFDPQARALAADAHRGAAGRALAALAGLVDAGVAEVATLPPGDAVLPILLDQGAPASGDPDAVLPAAGDWPEPAITLGIVDRGLETIERILDVVPSGAASSASSEATATALDAAGIRWVLVGEDVLAAALGGDPDEPLPPADRYRPWALADGPALFPGDPGLTAIAATAPTRGAAAADALVDRLEAVGAALDEPAVATVVVDGWGPWRYADDGGHAFLTRLFERLTAARSLVTATPADVLESLGDGEGALGVLPVAGRLDAADLRPWAGEPEEAAAWRLLADAALLTGAAPDGDPDRAATALDRAAAAAWFHALGTDGPGRGARASEAGFRRAVGAVYDALGLERPPVLAVPLVADRPDPDLGGPWSNGSVDLAVRPTPGGLDVEVAHPPSIVAFDLWVANPGIPGGRIVGDGLSLGMGADTVHRWSSVAPRRVVRLDASGGPLASPVEVGTDPATFEPGRVRFEIPVTATPGEPIRLRLVPFDAAGEPGAPVPTPGPGLVASSASLVLAWSDPTGDDHGPGAWVPPRDARFVDGAFDLVGTALWVTASDLVVQVMLGADLTDPFDAPSGLSLQTVDVALDADPGTATGRRSLPEGRNVALPEVHGYEALVTVDRQGARLATVAPDGDLVPAGDLEHRVDARLGLLTVLVPLDALEERPTVSWGAAVSVASSDPDEPTGIRPIAPDAGRWVGGGAPPGAAPPRVYDVLWPVAGLQESLLGEFRPAESTANLGPDDLATLPLVTTTETGS
ncbi:MAG: glucodextranase DOMON-like domain-containing protein [Acidimicrobiia bacterium]|nr:glucodextranase DOMON-like domain-containing protein [Acidimicrobiia bacterium]